MGKITITTTQVSRGQHSQIVETVASNYLTVCQDPIHHHAGIYKFECDYQYPVNVKFINSRVCEYITSTMEMSGFTIISKSLHEADVFNMIKVCKDSRVQITVQGKILNATNGNNVKDITTVYEFVRNVNNKHMTIHIKSVSFTIPDEYVIDAKELQETGCYVASASEVSSSM